MTNFFYRDLVPAIMFAMLTIPAQAEINNSCHGGSTNVCGVSFALPATTPAGSTATIPIPSYVLGDSNAANAGSLQNSDLSFSVECVSDATGAVSYRTIDADKISCNLFPCHAGTVDLCGIKIPVSAGTPLGGSLQVTMPAPFAQNSFTVQCAGTGDKPPVYQVTEHAEISCELH